MTAGGLRRVLGPGIVLRDDRPLLESSGLLRRAKAEGRKAIDVIADLAKAGSSEDPRVGPLQLWIASQAERAMGRVVEAEILEKLAAEAGLELAREGRARRWTEEGGIALLASDFDPTNGSLGG